jgi:hypothetical protein
VLSLITKIEAFAAGYFGGIQVKQSDAPPAAGYRAAKPDATSSVMTLSGYDPNGTVAKIERLAIYPSTKAQVKTIVVHVRLKMGSKQRHPENAVFSGSRIAQVALSKPRATVDRSI